MKEIRKLEYRCSRCKEVFQNGDEDSVDPDVIETNFDSHSSDIAMHKCSDGGIGVGDFIGYSPVIKTIYQNGYEEPVQKQTTWGKLLKKG